MSICWIKKMSDIFKVFSALGEGEAANSFAKIKAKQLNRQAIADKAESVQVAKHERKKATLLASRVTALAASSGAGVSSPDIQNSLSDIDEQGEYNALAALYSGESSAQSKRYAASVARAEGKFARKQSYLKAGATIMSSAESHMGMGE